MRIDVITRDHDAHEDTDDDGIEEEADEADEADEVHTAAAAVAAGGGGLKAASFLKAPGLSHGFHPLDGATSDADNPDQATHDDQATQQRHPAQHPAQCKAELQTELAPRKRKAAAQLATTEDGENSVGVVDADRCEDERDRVVRLRLAGVHNYSQDLLLSDRSITGYKNVSRARLQPRGRMC